MGRKPIADAVERKAGRSVLLALGRYHYLTLQQLGRYLGYAPKSRSKYMTDIVRELAKQHYVFNENSLGNDHKVHYGSAGIQSVASLTIKGHHTLRSWGLDSGAKSSTDYKRHADFLGHIYDLNQSLIALDHFGMMTPGIEIVEFMHDQVLSRKAVTVDLAGGRKTNVVPDAYVAYHLPDNEKMGIAIEQDRGTESKNDRHQGGNWFDKLEKLIVFAQGPYRTIFPYESLTYAIPINSIRKSNERRLEDLLNWTEEYLSATQFEDWAPIFKFTIADPVELDPFEFVTGNHWFEPFSRKAGPLVSPSYCKLS